MLSSLRIQDKDINKKRLKIEYCNGYNRDFVNSNTE